MNAQDLAKAMEDVSLRGSLMNNLDPEAVSAFEEYVSEYQESETVINKKDGS